MLNQTPGLTETLDYARAYVHYTLAANHFYALAKSNAEHDFNRARATYLDILACEYLGALANTFQASGQQIARDMYTAAYKAGETCLSYPLPLNLSSYTVGDMAAQYPGQTCETFPEVDTFGDLIPAWAA